MRAFDRHGQILLQLGRAAGVVDVAVREQDLLDRDAGLGDGGPDAVEVAAGIDDGGALRVLVPQQRAVLLERGDGDDRGLGFGHGSERRGKRDLPPIWRPRAGTASERAA